MFYALKVKELSCCKKRQRSPNQETGLGTSEGSEWYQIDPKWAWVTPLIIYCLMHHHQTIRRRNWRARSSVGWKHLEEFRSHICTLSWLQIKVTIPYVVQNPLRKPCYVHSMISKLTVQISIGNSCCHVS